MKFAVRSLVALLILAALIYGGWSWWERERNRLPEFIASGNGRIEAEEIHISTKYAGRVREVLVDEGDTVEAGQVVARLDASELEASLARAEAEIARARQAVSEAGALVEQRKSELTFATQELNRALFLVEKGHVSVERLDQRQTEHDAARAALAAARAYHGTTEQAVEAALAEARRIQTQIDDHVLLAPKGGRIQHRLAEPGEVLAAGDKVVTLLDLTDVYMTIFLPTAQAGRVFIGNQGRIILDAAPDYVIPAKVSFVSAEAQFTPREVETRSEREKLMFRVILDIDREVLLAYQPRVKTGLPGEAYVMLGTGSDWPDQLAVKLPPR